MALIPKGEKIAEKARKVVLLKYKNLQLEAELLQASYFWIRFYNNFV